MLFSYMKVYCPICKSEMDGMRHYGRDSHCCGKDCHEEWEWRNTLAILGKEYYPDPKKVTVETKSITV